MAVPVVELALEAGRERALGGGARVRPDHHATGGGPRARPATGAPRSLTLGGHGPLVLARPEGWSP
jgi:hypothetical protein